MNNNDSRSRLNKFDKRRKNTKAITILAVIGSLFLLVLLVILMFGGKKDIPAIDDNNADQDIENNESDNFTNETSENGSNNSNNEENGHVNNNENDDDATNNNEDTNEENDVANSNDNDSEIVEHDVSDDENVISAFSKNWDPIGTKQSEPHVVQYDDGTQDRIEMEQAIMHATGLDEMITWWLGNDGDQKIVATVTSMDQTENYRVYLSWVSNEGWQPTKVEILKTNDKK